MVYLIKQLKFKYFEFYSSVHLDLGCRFQFRFRPLVFHMVRAVSKAYAFQNSKLIKLITLNYNHYTKAWLRLMYLMNSEENQGFLVRFFAVFDPEHVSYVTHGGSTKMSGEGSIIERQNCLNCLKFVQIAKLGFIFRFMGLGWVLSVDWFLA